MKSDDLFKQLGEIREEYVEEALKETKQSSPLWLRFVAAAAVLCLVVGGWWLLSRGMTPAPSVPTIVETYESDDELVEENLPKIAVSLMPTTSGTTESDIDMAALPTRMGNPWSPEDNITTFPVYGNRLMFDKEVKLSENTLGQMKERLKEVADRLGMIYDESLIVETYSGYTISFETRNLALQDAAYQVNVNSQVMVWIELMNPITLPDSLTFITEPSVESAQEVGRYLLEQHPELFRFVDPIVEVEVSATGQGTSYRLLFFEKGATATDTVLNYRMDQISIPLYNNQVQQVSDLKYDKSLKLGDFEMITPEEAKSRLLAGQFQTILPGKMPKEEDIERVELEPWIGIENAIYSPYYRFITKDGTHYFVPALTKEAASRVKKMEPEVSEAMFTDITLNVQSPEDILSANPFPDKEWSHLPVLRNQVLAPDGTILPERLEQMKKRLEEVARLVGEDFDETKVFYNNPMTDLNCFYIECSNGLVSLNLQTDDANIEVGADLRTRLQLSKQPLLPEGAKLDYEHAMPKQLLKAGEYLKDKYAGLLGENLVAGVDNQPLGGFNYRLFLYPDSSDPLTKFLNYQLNQTYVQGRGAKRFYFFTLNQVDLSESVGSYPIISFEEAKSQLLQGKYWSSFDETISEESNFASVELVYRLNKEGDLYLPFYRFLVELPEWSHEGSLAYGSYYVSAIEPKFIE